jgi:signal transduction histidine kinase/CheY-like chemotaxis protein
MAPDLFENLPDPAIHLAAHGAPLASNAAFRNLVRHAVTAARPPWGRATPPPFDNGRRRFEARAPDGTLIEWSETLLADGTTVAIGRDVTRWAEAADSTSRAKTTLFATLTHELRTPLNGILGMTGLLESAPLDPAHREYLAAIKTSGEHLLDLITEILDFSRLESGNVRLEEVAFDPEDTIQSVIELLSPKAREKGLEIVARIDPATPPKLVGDEGRLKQILFNLLGNAVKFTAKGGVQVETVVSPQAIRYVVRDTGPGVDPDKQAVIFEAFGQADASHARLYGGAGLGLAIVRRLAEAMGGKAGVRSRPGEGASFWIDLPLTPAVLDERPPPPRLDGLRIGVLARSELVAEALAYTVEGLGGEVTDAAGSAVVLVDHDVACGDPRPWIEARRPFVVLAPQEDRGAIAAYREAGVAHYLCKPLRRRSLAERVLLAVHARPAPIVEPASKPEPARGDELRVLVAEDNPINALLVRRLLERNGCQVVIAADGEEAVARVAEEAFDLVFLDLRMPRLDGAGAARRIRAMHGPAAKLPLIALTADAGEEDRAAALAAGMDDFLTKPISAARLEAVTTRFNKRTM